MELVSIQETGISILLYIIKFNNMSQTKSIQITYKSYTMHFSVYKRNKKFYSIHI